MTSLLEPLTNLLRSPPFFGARTLVRIACAHSCLPVFPNSSYLGPLAKCVAVPPLERYALGRGETRAVLKISGSEVILLHPFLSKVRPQLGEIPPVRLGADRLTLEGLNVLTFSARP